MIVKEFIKDNLHCEVFSDRDGMGRVAAARIGRAIRELSAVQEEVNMVFAAAPSQNDVLRYLAKEDVDWSKVNAFHMDEYVGLPAGSEQSFAHYLDSTLFCKVRMKGIFYIGGGEAQALCRRYDGLLREHPLDIVCLGIGENGHIAFNDPDVANFADEQTVKLVELDEVCRRQQVHDKTFETLDEVPKQAVTLTVPTLFSAKYLFCVVPGAQKAEAVYRTVCDPVDTKIPATILRRHPNASMFTDTESARLLLNG